MYMHVSSFFFYQDVIRWNINGMHVEQEFQRQHTRKAWKFIAFMIQEANYMFMFMIIMLMIIYCYVKVTFNGLDLLGSCLAGGFQVLPRHLDALPNPKSCWVVLRPGTPTRS